MVPLLLLLALGTVELAQFMRANTSVTTLAREGARTASAESRLDGFTEDAAAAVARSATSLPLDRIEVWVYFVNPLGVNADGDPPATCGIGPGCVKYSGWVEATGKFSLRNGAPIASSTEAATWPAGSINACLRDDKNDGNGVSQSVGVLVTARHDYLFNMIFPEANTTIRSHTVMKFEPVIPRTPSEKCAP